MNLIISFLRKIISAFFILIIRLYQFLLSPILGASCRFTPTCSQYGLEAIRKYGPFKGGWLTLKRIGRCHPWGKHGPDPVP
ncbi:MAG: membrane protein insertion efficiency factor YidD [Sphingobacteriaceae bacterium]|nr:MAG: membrane protein insertion efficiency factor YidD [Sphingobacteriaceae bacterium]